MERRKFMKKGLLFILAVLFSVGCPPPGPSVDQGGGSGGNKDVAVEISFGQSKMTLWKNTASRIAVTVNTTAAEKGFILQSSDKEIVDVVQKGNVTVLVAGNTAGTVELKAISKANSKAQATCSVEVPEGVQEVVHRNGKGYRIASLFDFSKTGVRKEWTQHQDYPNNAVFEVDSEKGELTFKTPGNAAVTGGVSYPLTIAEALYPGVEAGKTLGYVEITASLSNNGLNTAIGCGLGTVDAAQTDTNPINQNQKRGWANEFFNNWDASIKARLKGGRSPKGFSVEPNTYHTYGMIFEKNLLMSFFDATSIYSVTNPDNFEIPSQETYWLYFGTEDNNANQSVTVTVDHVAFYYLDESIEVIEFDENGDIIETVTPPAPGMIPAKVAVEGKVLSLTYYDPFDSMETLEADWDIGNPGIQRPEIGNMGLELSGPKTFGPDGIRGYENDRYKQPYWSPKAVRIKDGCLWIDVFYDKTIPNKNISTTTDSTTEPAGDSFIPNKGANQESGYGLAGAVHSKRQFPSGLFVTKIRHDFSGRDSKNASHWDAWWAESNNPFSKEYGNKTLFMPPGAAAGINQIAKYKFNNENNLHSNAAARGLNGQQVYEYDMYEWVSNDNTQWMVTHMWSWYGGYPGWDDRMSQGATYGGGSDGNYYITNDFRKNDKEGAVGRIYHSYQDAGQARSQDWFYLAMLVTSDGLVRMYNFPSDWNWNFNDIPTSSAREVFYKGCFGNAECPTPFPADEWAPIQVKYSSELGQWNNNHDLIYDARDTLTEEKPDSTVAEFFAFYAWDTGGKYPEIGNDVND